jgi:hypothetical protein
LSTLNFQETCAGFRRVQVERAARAADLKRCPAGIAGVDKASGCRTASDAERGEQ